MAPKCGQSLQTLMHAAMWCQGAVLERDALFALTHTVRACGLAMGAAGALLSSFTHQTRSRSMLQASGCRKIAKARGVGLTFAWQL